MGGDDPPFVLQLTRSQPTVMIPSNAIRIAGSLINPANPADVRHVQWEAVYGGWRDDSKGSRTHGKIYTDATMNAIVATYPNLKVTVA